MAIYRKRKNGAWYVRYDLPPDPLTGKRRQRQQSGFRTKGDAERWMRNKQRDIDRGRGILPENLTLEEYLNQWHAAHAPTVKPHTAFTYRRIIDRYVLPHLAGVLLQALTPVMLRAWHQRLAETGLGPGTVHRAHGLLNQALRRAELDGMLPNNPAASSWPRNPKSSRQRNFWSPSEIQRFLAIVDADTTYGLLFKTALLTGLRVGELQAMEWDQVDLQDGRLEVTRTETRTADGKWTIGPPKSPRSQRTLSIPDSLRQQLQRHRVEQATIRLELPGWWNHDRVFCHISGKRFTRHTLRTRLAKLARQADIPVLTMHGLRRSAASWLVALGEHPRAIQDRLGHETIAMSMDLYAEVSNEVQDRLAARLDDALES